MELRKSKIAAEKQLNAANQNNQLRNSKRAGFELTDEIFPPAAIDLWHDRSFECAMRKAS